MQVRAMLWFARPKAVGMGGTALALHQESDRVKLTNVSPLRGVQTVGGKEQEDGLSSCRHERSRESEGGSREEKWATHKK
jgi:hypothetical protein